MSMMGLYSANPNLFNDLDTTITAIADHTTSEAVITGFLSLSAELEVLYAEPSVCQQILGAYCVQRNLIWKNLYDSQHFQYNPIWNYDRTDEETINKSDTRSGTTTGSTTGNSKRVDDSRYNQQDNTSNQAGRYGYNNSTSASPEATSTSANNSAGATLASSVNDASTSSNGTMSESSTGDETRTLHSFGNIGVMDTATLIQRYRDITDFDWVQFVIDDLIGRFCLLVY